MSNASNFLNNIKKYTSAIFAELSNKAGVLVKKTAVVLSYEPSTKIANIKFLTDLNSEPIPYLNRTGRALSAGDYVCIFHPYGDENSGWITLKINIDASDDFSLNIQSADKVIVSDSDKQIISGDITTTELSYLEGVSSNLQQQMNNKASIVHSHAINNITGLQEELSTMSEATEEVISDISNVSAYINTINSNIATMAGDITELQTPKEVVLWTNPNPNSGFQPQTIAVNLLGYDYVSILATFTNTANDFSNITTTKVGNKGVISITMTSPDSTASAASFLNGAYRKFQTSTTGITFENGQMTYAGNAYENWAGRAVPQQIIGKKLN